MSRIKIVQENPGDILSGFGTTVELDGKEVKYVRHVSVSIGVDEVVSANVEVLAHESFELEVGAQVNVSVIPLPDMSIETKRLPDGGYRHTAVWSDEQTEPRFRLPRRIVGVTCARDAVDVTHFKSSAAHRQSEPGLLRAYAYLRVPVWVFDWYLRIQIRARSLFRKSAVSA